ncbi:MAG: InlB B-repeat-containing protein, partial [Butyrivibrio sp.]|nr:InlB B-repeat-containing protein [Butyrivibrio sp.]
MKGLRRTKRWMAMLLAFTLAFSNVAYLDVPAVVYAEEETPDTPAEPQPETVGSQQPEEPQPAEPEGDPSTDNTTEDPQPEPADPIENEQEGEELQTTVTTDPSEDNGQIEGSADDLDDVPAPEADPTDNKPEAPADNPDSEKKPAPDDEQKTPEEGKKEYTVTFSLSGANGTVKVSTPDSGEMTEIAEDYFEETLAEASQVTFTVQADEGYVIEKVMVNDERKYSDSQDGDTYTYILESIDSDKAVKISFTEEAEEVEEPDAEEEEESETATYKLTVNVPEANGTVTVSTAADENADASKGYSADVEEGTNVSLTAEPAEGYVIDSVEVNGQAASASSETEEASTYEIAEIKEDTEVTITFQEEMRPVIFKAQRAAVLADVSVKEYTITVDEEITLSGSGSYYREHKWVSSDENVVTLQNSYNNNRKIAVGKANGIAEITHTWSENGKTQKEIFKITVKEGITRVYIYAKLTGDLTGFGMGSYDWYPLGYIDVSTNVLGKATNYIRDQYYNGSIPTVIETGTFHQTNGIVDIDLKELIYDKGLKPAWPTADYDVNPYGDQQWHLDVSYHIDKKQSYSLTIEYKYHEEEVGDLTLLPENVDTNLKSGDKYKYPLPVISEYIAYINGEKVAENVTNVEGQIFIGNVKKEVVYHKDANKNGIPDCEETQVQISFETNGGTAVAAITGLEGTKIEGQMPTTNKTGYDFAGWYDNENLTGNAVTNLPGTMPAGGATYYAKWVASNAAYKVEHYQQTLDGKGYKLTDTDNLTGKTGAEVSATAKTYAGFTLNEEAEGTLKSGTIDGDGKLVLKLYYDRNTDTAYKVEHYQQTLDGKGYKL